MSQVSAELRKLLSLPTAWVGLAIGLLLVPATVLLNVPFTRRAIANGTLMARTDLGLGELTVGVIGPLILGVVVVSSEYTSTDREAAGACQLTATLTAMPHRLRLLAAKATALLLVVTAQAAVATALTLTLVRALYGGYVPPPEPTRIAGAIVYWVFTGLLAYSITLATRTGIVPLTLLIANSTMVSVSYLLTKITNLACYLPDLAGIRMFLRDADLPVTLPPTTAGLVMAAWVAVALAVGAALFHRRDA